MMSSSRNPLVRRSAFARGDAKLVRSLRILFLNVTDSTGSEARRRA